ncbi:MAG: hypothetical protein JNG89_12245 [Planctomycetaceae bacterium]|nr:hypothetical protein [Planctomycetaceae bacterium]
MSTQVVQHSTATAGEDHGSAVERRNARLTFAFTVVLALMILIPSMLGFIAKFIELFAVLNGDPDGVFALTPILNYLLASLGFFSLLLWAASRGMFHDVENPKRAMLEREDLLDGRAPNPTTHS